MRLSNTLLIFLSLTVIACHNGTNAADLAVANRVSGATVRVRSLSGRFDAELLEIRQDGIVLLQQNGRVAIAPWKVTKMVSVVGLGRDYTYGLLMPPSRQVFANLTKVSHFPQGMTPDIERRFLASRGQTELEVIQ